MHAFLSAIGGFPRYHGVMEYSDRCRYLHLQEKFLNFSLLYWILWCIIFPVRRKPFQISHGMFDGVSRSVNKQISQFDGILSMYVCLCMTNDSNMYVMPFRLKVKNSLGYIGWVEFPDAWKSFQAFIIEPRKFIIEWKLKVCFSLYNHKFPMFHGWRKCWWCMIYLNIFLYPSMYDACFGSIRKQLKIMFSLGCVVCLIYITHLWKHNVLPVPTFDYA